MPKQRIDRADIVAAALEAADRDGLDELALARIAGELGVQSSALYNHVDGMDGLLAAASAQASDNLAERLRDAAVARSGAVALRAVAEAYRTFAREHPGQYASTLLPVGSAIDSAQGPQAAIVDIIVRILESFGREGDAAVHGARIVRSAVHGFVTLEASEAFINPQETDESFAALLDFVVDGFADRPAISGESAA